MPALRRNAGRRWRRAGAAGGLLMAEIVDVDSHVYEPASLWDDYVPSADRASVQQAFSSRVEDDGTVITTLNGRAAKGLNRSHIVRQAIWRPGMTVDDIGALDPNVAHPLNPGAWDPAARLADMDSLEVDRAVVYPTLLNEYLPQIEDPGGGRSPVPGVQRLDAGLRGSRRRAAASGRGSSPPGPDGGTPRSTTRARDGIRRCAAPTRLLSPGRSRRHHGRPDVPAHGTGGRERPLGSLIGLRRGPTVPTRLRTLHGAGRRRVRPPVLEHLGAGRDLEWRFRERVRSGSACTTRSPNLPPICRTWIRS